MDKIIKLATHDEAREVAGLHDTNLKRIEKECKVKIVLRGGELKVSGTAIRIRKAEAIVRQTLDALRSGDPETGRQARAAAGSSLGPAGGTSHHTPIGPKTKGQREYVEAIKHYDIIFGVGPAGTGKTYLAMVCAVEALKRRQVRRIILTRPAVEAAGESLGFLPGSVSEKISPYLRPLYDALYDMMDAERIEKYLETGIIEVAPLAFMRGRTLNEAFIVLDEAQNCTAEQMKMFLTRLGFDSKAVITGDLTQSDLPNARPVGLLQAEKLLQTINGIKFIYFTGSDVVRHPLVQRIIEAYDKASRKK
ncbi:MAG: PhoH family protein [Candidatus Omnitrophica bacterium]|nr:PhoH family protein [Candidatus Omnitrophota bacterium]